jgi:hypothetical protein
MLRHAVAVVLLLSLPSCIAAIGNKGVGWDEVPASALPLVRDKVDALKRIVDLRQQQLDNQRTALEAGRGDATTVAGAEIELQEAKIRLLDARVELQALEGRTRD